MNATTSLFAKSKNSNFVSEFICDFSGYVTLYDDAVQLKIEQMEKLGFHSFSTSVVYE